MKQQESLNITILDKCVPELVIMFLTEEDMHILPVNIDPSEYSSITFERWNNATNTVDYVADCVVDGDLVYHTIMTANKAIRAKYIDVYGCSYYSDFLYPYGF